MSLKNLIILIFSVLILLIVSAVTGTEGQNIEIKESSSGTDTAKIISNEIVDKNPTESALSPSNHVDINSALKEDLIALTGIGPTIAERILEYRKLHGAFKSMDDLIDIKGIGPKKLIILKKEAKVY